jgi:anti-sigma factor RsiW
MTRGIEYDLMRLLRGELPDDEARSLRGRLERDPELAAAYERLESAWTGLALPEPAPVPPGFTGRVMARVREQPAGISWEGWTGAPAWARAAAVAALLAGVALGAGAGSLWQETAPATAAATTLEGEDSLSLAESYWSVLGEGTEGEELQ